MVQIYDGREALNELETLMRIFITNVAKSGDVDIERLWELLLEGVSKYGLIDYVAVGDISLGPEALYKLGYRVYS